MLDEMYTKAKENAEPFYNLIELMKHRETILTAIHNIKSNKGSKTVGVDDKDINEYLQMNETALLGTIRNYIDNYHPSPVRRVYIPKPGTDKKRPLGIPAMIDRIIQELARIVLEPVAEAKFYEYSFGFRPFRSVAHAQAEIMGRVTRSKMYVAIEGDIKGFFDNINHSKLIKMMWAMGIRDKRYLAIIKKMLKAGYMKDGKKYVEDIGTPQGGIISPLLANIYLNNFDWMIAKMFQAHPARQLAPNPFKQGLKKVAKYHKKCQIIRYADDWVILCEDRKQAESILIKCRKYLKHVLKIELSEEKTLITDLREKRMKFLGFEFFVNKNPNSKAKRISCRSLPNIEKLKGKVREIAKDIRSIHNKRDQYGNGYIIELINSKIVGIAEFYKVCHSAHIMKRADQKIYMAAYKKWCKMKSNGQKRRWENYVIPANQVRNRPNRHGKRNDRIFYLEVDGVKIGLTKFSFTKSKMQTRIKTGLTPYTPEGRKLYERMTGKNFLKDRQTLYTIQMLKLRTKALQNKLISPRYNYEYIMNREYACNRDKCKCKCCDVALHSDTIHCHHIKPWLPLDEVNKVPNLATICKFCHQKIHGGRPNIGTAKSMQKIENYQKALKRPAETVS